MHAVISFRPSVYKPLEHSRGWRTYIMQARLHALTCVYTSGTFMGCSINSWCHDCVSFTLTTGTLTSIDQVRKSWSLTLFWNNCSKREQVIEDEVTSASFSQSSATALLVDREQDEVACITNASFSQSPATTVEPRFADSLKYGHRVYPDSWSRSRMTYDENVLSRTLKNGHLDNPECGHPHCARTVQRSS